jgi:hypothetical protein
VRLSDAGSSKAGAQPDSKIQASEVITRRDRHAGPEEVESVYVFVSLVQLLRDFDTDIEQLSGEIK